MSARKSVGQSGRGGRRRAVKGKDNKDDLLSGVDFGAPAFVLRGKQVDAALMADLCKALSVSDILSEIDLADNALGDDGAEVLAQFISKSPHITSVNVSHNMITAWGCARIAKACRKHLSIQSLNLAGNEVGVHGMAELGRLVIESQVIRELVLADTEVGFEETISFAECMIQNNSLLYLSVPFTLGYRVIEEIEKILRRNWARHNRFDEQINVAAVLMGRIKQQKEMSDAQWKSEQAKREPESARTKTSLGTMGEWADPDTGATMLYLSLLNRKGSAIPTPPPSSPASTTNTSRSQPMTPRRTLGGASSTNGSTRLPPLPSPRIARSPRYE